MLMWTAMPAVLRYSNHLHDVGMKKRLAPEEEVDLAGRTFRLADDLPVEIHIHVPVLAFDGFMLCGHMTHRRLHWLVGSRCSFSGRYGTFGVRRSQWNMKLKGAWVKDGPVPLELE